MYNNNNNKNKNNNITEDVYKVLALYAVYILQSVIT